MSEHFIREIEIKNFKCFEDFKAEGFGRVNLIGGKNNVGKTAFMEALELHLTSTDSFSLAFSLYNLVRRRQSSDRRERYFELDFIYKNSSRLELKINNKHIIVEYYDELDDYVDDISDENNLDLKYEPSLKLSVNDHTKVFPINRVIDRPPMMRKPAEAKNELKVNFISTNKIEESEIAILYGKLIDLNKENFLNEYLELFDDNIVALKQKAIERGVVLKLLLKNQEFPVLLSSLGDGINRYIAILCGIWASKDGYLFIDEIENGIHHSNYDKLWRIIFKVSDEANCQLFITTHSNECMNSFNSIQFDLEKESKDTYYFEMAKNIKTDKIFMFQMDSEQLEYGLSHNERLRGE